MKRNDLTDGSIISILLSFALPFLFANLLQSLYGAVDLLVVGLYCGAESVAAVSTGTQITQIVSSLITGLTVGSTILVADYCGRKDYEALKRTIGSSFFLFLFFGLLITVLMLCLNEKLLELLNAPRESFQQSLSYVTICSAGTVFICLYNAVSAVLRGCGDSRRPLYFIALACVLNIFLDFLFVKYFKMDVSGTAFATIISQAISMLCAVIYLKKQSFIFDFCPRSFIPDFKILKKLLSLGLPVSFQELAIRISFLYIAFAMNSCGLYAGAIVGIGSKYDVFAMLSSNSMAAALTAITAQNMGAGKPERARKALWECIAVSFTIALGFFLWAQLSPETMISLFSKDENIIRTGIPYFRSASWDYLMVSLLFCLNAYLNGRQKTIWTMVSSCFSALCLRMPLTAYVLHHYEAGLGLIGCIAPAVTAFTALYTLIYVLSESRKKQLL